MGSISDGANPATETLLWTGPFEVLRLVPGVYQPDEIKRQYRRLALILHPDKNRHQDAEAAFKKLTAAFEKLHDPVQQAGSRAEAERNAHRSRKRKSSGAHGASGAQPSSTRPTNSGDGRGGAGGTGDDAPRWCREGEYVPEQRKEPREEGAEKQQSTQNVWVEFEHEERAFKEEVAQAKELAAEKKRAKTEARERTDQERIQRLRESILGDQGAGRVEAKTASWQRFTATRTSSCTTSTKRRHTESVESSSRRNDIEETSSLPTAPTNNSTNELGAGGSTSSFNSDSKVRSGLQDSSTGAVVGTDGSSGARDGSDGQENGGNDRTDSFICWVCRRSFKSAKGLAHHETKSELHLLNVQLRDFFSP